MSYINTDEIVFNYGGLAHINPHDFEGTAKYFYDQIKAMPPADVKPVVHGHWIIPTVINSRAFNIPHCSVCGEVPCGVDEHTKYCPNCGTEMDEKVNE